MRTNFLLMKKVILMIDSEDSVLSQVLVVASRVSGKTKLSAESGLRNGWDSLTHVQILLAIESEFNCEVPQEKFGELVTAKQIVSWICGLHEKQ